MNLLRGAQEAAVEPAREWQSRDPHQGQSDSKAHTLPQQEGPDEACAGTWKASSPRMAGTPFQARSLCSQK